jgi:hypothetical protein
MRSWVPWAAALVIAAVPAPRNPQTTSAVACDTTEFHRLKVRVLFSEDRARHYANIVAHDPSQARFLNGWMQRAFKDVLPPR